MNPGDAKVVEIYTDGACSGNPGPGGWAAIILEPGTEPKELAGAESQTSNNQMEVRAVIEALKALSVEAGRAAIAHPVDPQ